MINKICKICGIELTNENSYLSYIKNCQYICKKCEGKHQLEYRQQHNKEKIETNSRYYQRNKDKIKEKNKKYRQDHKYECKKRSIQYYQENKEKIKKDAQNLKLKVFNYYCNNEIKCNCCGEKHIEFLTIDHIDCGKLIHGKNKKPNNHNSGTPFYRWLVSNNFPDGYQVLCYNCNCAKGFFGWCPHDNIFKR